VPQLLGEVPPGESILATAILDVGCAEDGRAAWNQPPQAPRISDLEAIVRAGDARFPS